jgi:hypothetical protein
LWPRTRPPTSPEEAHDQRARHELRELAFFLLRHGVVLAPTGLGCLATTTEAGNVEYLLSAVEQYVMDAA